MFRQLAEGLLKKSGISDYQLGTSKVFLRAGQMALLDKQRTDTLNASAIRLQRYARSYLARQHFKKAKQAVIRMQVRSSKLLVKGSGCCCCCCCCCSYFSLCGDWVQFCCGHAGGGWVDVQEPSHICIIGHITTPERSL
jgi:hypothetical protein